jgi:hypothetical protein
MLIVAGWLGALVAFAGWGLFGGDPFGSEPMAVVSVGATADGAATTKPATARGGAAGRPQRAGPNAQKAPLPPEKPSPGANGPAGPAEQIVTIIDGKSGARQEVHIPATAETAGGGGGGGPGGVSGAESQLIELTRNGPIPRIGADGLRAAQAYAKPVAGKLNAPQIALVISGLGVSANGTSDAINKLPGPITFACDLERLTTKAQGSGQELLLEVPMEPFDYPDNDPGPQTLITSLSPEPREPDRRRQQPRFRQSESRARERALGFRDRSCAGAA